MTARSKIQKQNDMLKNIRNYEHPKRAAKLALNVREILL
jgi:hypothetical protein